MEKKRANNGDEVLKDGSTASEKLEHILNIQVRFISSQVLFWERIGGSEALASCIEFSEARGWKGEEGVTRYACDNIVYMCLHVVTS